MCPVYVMIAAPFTERGHFKDPDRCGFLLISGAGLIVGQNLSEGYGYLGMALSAVSGMLYATIILLTGA